MSKLDIEIDPASLGDTPIHPPHRILRDFLPLVLKSWLRRKFNILPASPREVWVLKSLFLRIFYNTQRVEQLIEKTPKPFYTSDLVDDKGNPNEKDPWRWS